MKIRRVEEKSPADKAGFRNGDDVLEINGYAIRDEIDFHFYAADEQLEFLVRRQDDTLAISLPEGIHGRLGLEFEGMEYRSCGNNCVFCFVDQNPPGLRPALYFKDEDYRLSFLYGNYVTLTNASRKNLQRIVDQRLSPLYISVHAVDPLVRQKLLGLRRDDRLLEKMAFLASRNIQMHAQLVLCPGWNDGGILEDTMRRLADLYPAVQSIAVVPLGLTRHRRNLVELKPVSRQVAADTIAQVEATAQRFKNALGSFFVYLADEFYLKADLAIPPEERYDDFPQIENGVGMCRRFLQDIRKEKRNFPKSVRKIQAVIVTGRSAAPFLEKHLMPIVQTVKGFSADVIEITNRFLGPRVTVSGLLTGRDIYHQLKNRRLGNIVFLPPNCLNEDGLFLDDWTPQQLEEKLGVRVYQPIRLRELFKQL
jgi:putative radical SAM enzyme (TIGR03279 family)